MIPLTGSVLLLGSRESGVIAEEPHRCLGYPFMAYEIGMEAGRPLVFCYQGGEWAPVVMPREERP